MSKYTKKIIVICLGFLFFLPQFTGAAGLYLESERADYSYLDTFVVDAKIELDDGDECVNVVEGDIVFPADILNLVDFSAGDSILRLWVEKPTQLDMDQINTDGNVRFSGGLPGGYCGRISGDIGVSNILARLVFSAKNADTRIDQETVHIYFASSSSVYLNDGAGTQVYPRLAEINILLFARRETPVSQWNEIINSDKTPPEPFVVELMHDARIYDGQYYIVFSTTDKESGMDYYEVMEDSRYSKEGKQSWLLSLLNSDTDKADWIRADTIYLLQDQDLHSLIKVRAVDKAGNERVIEFMPQNGVDNVSDKISYFYLFVILFIVVLVLLVAFVIIRKSFSNNKSKGETTR